MLSEAIMIPKVEWDLEETEKFWRETDKDVEGMERWPWSLWTELFNKIFKCEMKEKEEDS